MKRTATLIYGVIISTVIFLLSSCTNEMSIDWTKAVMFSTPHYLKVSQTMLSFSEGEGGTHSLKVTATGTSWELKDLPEWLTADKMSGTEDATIAITCTPNPSSTEARAAIIYIHSTVTGWDYSIPVSVSQSRCKAYANPASTSVTFDGSEGVQTLSVTSNVADWKVTSSQEWLTAEKGADGKSVTLTVKANTGKASRRAYVTLKTTDTESQITVDQRPGNISATLDKMTFTHEDSTQMVTITSDASWTVQTSSSWIEVLPSSGDAGTTEVSVRASANNSFDPRTGFIYFVMTDNNKVELPVEQGAVTFSLSETALDFDRNGGKKSIVVETNTEWTLMSDLPDWLTLSATEGTGTTEVTFSVKENGSVSSRKATVRFRPKKIGTFFEVKVTQSEQTFRMDVPTLQFTNEGGSFLLSFEATGAWTATASADWITVSPTSGTGSATCTVTVEPNEGDNRSGEVVLTSYDLTYRIPVTQQAPFLTLSTEGLQFDSKGGTLNVDVSTNLPWSASVKDNAAWLSVSPTAGEQSGKMGITASDNPTLESRDGKVEVVSQGLPNLFVAVSQAARYLTLSTEAIDFVAKGGESERITIDTDGEFTISTESDWITINKTSEKSFILTVTENSTSEERRGMVVVSMTDLTSGELARIIAVTQRSMYGTVNGHAYVDLGLPSGALWATMNVGASSPDDFGDYFAWGETEPKESYDLTNYKWCKIVGYNRYETTKYSSLDDKQILESEDDAATVNWGEQWHTPSGTEWTELFNNCTRIWTSQNGVEGLKLTSNLNENSIFFPAAGKSDTSYSGSGCYWHNSIIYYAWDGHDGYSFASYELMNQNGEKEEMFDNYISFRYQGLSIRPVYQPNYLKLSSKELSLPPAGGNESVILETNLSWTASKDVSWIHLSANSGSGNMTLQGLYPLVPHRLGSLTLL